MAWYRTGTCTVTNGSAIVTFAGGADVLANAFIDDGFTSADGKVYPILTINSATQLTLAIPYQGPTLAGQVYRIVPVADFMQLRSLVVQVNALISSYQQITLDAGAGRFANGSAAAPGVRGITGPGTGLVWTNDAALSIAVGGSIVAAFGPGGATNLSFGNGTAALPSITFGSDPDTGIFRPGANQFAITTAGTESVRVLADGKVGIGTTAPGHLLDVNGSARVGGTAGVGFINFSSTTVVNIGAVGCAVTTGFGDSVGIAVQNPSGVLTLATNSTERVRITNAGLVGIGVAAPATKLEVGGGIQQRVTVTSDLEGSLFNSSLDLRRTGTAAGARIVSLRNAAGGVGFSFQVTSNNAAEVAGTLAQAMAITNAGEVKIGTGAAVNTSRLMVNMPSGSAAGIQLFQDGNESWIIQNPASTNVLTFGASGTERARITSAGLFGIGNTAPTVRLDVLAPATGDVAKFSAAGSQALHFYADATTIGMFNVAGAAAERDGFRIISDAVCVDINATEMARFNANGFGWGTVPAVNFHIKTTATAEGIRYESPNARGAGNQYMSFVDATGRKCYFGYGGAGTDIFHLVNESASAQMQITTPGTLNFSGGGSSIALAAGAFRPSTDNNITNGASGLRWSVVWAGTGTISTSDARTKTEKRDLTKAELKAASRIAKTIGVFKFLDGNREHVGIIAQEVWHIMAEEGLIKPLSKKEDPTCKYAFLCWDKWDEEREPVFEDVEVTKTRMVKVRSEEPDPETGEHTFSQKEETYTEVEMQKVGERVSVEAGDRFSIRSDQLALFIQAAQEQRIAALEAALAKAS